MFGDDNPPALLLNLLLLFPTKPKQVFPCFANPFNSGSIVLLLCFILFIFVILLLISTFKFSICCFNLKSLKFCSFLKNSLILSSKDKFELILLIDEELRNESSFSYDLIGF